MWRCSNLSKRPWISSLNFRTGLEDCVEIALTTLAQAELILSTPDPADSLIHPSLYRGSPAFCSLQDPNSESTHSLSLFLVLFSNASKFSLVVQFWVEQLCFDCLNILTFLPSLNPTNFLKFQQVFWDIFKVRMRASEIRHDQNTYNRKC